MLTIRTEVEARHRVYYETEANTAAKNLNVTRSRRQNQQHLIVWKAKPGWSQQPNEKAGVEPEAKIKICFYLVLFATRYLEILGSDMPQLHAP